MKRAVTVLSVLILLSGALYAGGDLSGKWAGAFNITADGQSKDDSAHIVLKQTGNELTGTGGPNSDEQYPILNGKVDGEKILFDVQTPGPLIKFELTLVEGHLKGKAHAEMDGRSMSAVVDLERKS